MIEKVKTRPLDHAARIGLFLGSEEDRGAKDALASFNKTPVMKPFFGQTEEVEHLGSKIETNLPGFSPKGKCGNPDRNESFLDEGQAVCWMGDDLLCHYGASLQGLGNNRTWRGRK